MGKKSKEREEKKSSKRVGQKRQTEKQSRDRKLKSKSRRHKKTRSDIPNKGQKKKKKNQLQKNRKKKTKNKSNKKMEIFLSGVLVFLVCLIALVVFLLFHYTKGEVISGSMEPTLGVNDRVIIDKKKDAKRFDMIVFYPQDNKNEKWVKRIIGLPGERIDYFDDHLYVNSKEVKEPFLEQGKKETKKPYTNDFDLSQIPGMKPGEDKIPKDCYLVMGDNRQNSEDSRVIGLVKKDQIEGVVLFRYAPLSKFGSVYDTKK